MLIGVDPGNTQSAFVHLEGGRPIKFGIWPNDSLLQSLKETRVEDEVVIEMIQSFGMSVGREVFDTVFWVGRFFQATPSPAYLLYRQDVKLHICKSPKANDGTIRQALIDRFGPSKEKAIGKKNSQGPLYGCKDDEWQALALACTWHDMRAKRVSA